MSLHGGQYMTLTFVVRTQTPAEFAEDPRGILDDDNVMFWASEDGITDKAIDLGADVSSWHDSGPDLVQDAHDRHQREVLGAYTQDDHEALMRPYKEGQS